jgi:hypothetical protein
LCRLASNLDPPIFTFHVYIFFKESLEKERAETWQNRVSFRLPDSSFYSFPDPGRSSQWWVRKLGQG